MNIHATHTFDTLASRLGAAGEEIDRELPKVPKRVAQKGNRVAQRLAKVSAGEHGKHYPDAITLEQLGPMDWEYGPDASLPQGGMSFEGGSRNQPPHNDIAKSYDAIAGELADGVADVFRRALA